MEKDTTVFGLNPKTLARILNIGSDVNGDNVGEDQEQRKLELFQDWLAATLPIDVVVAESVPVVLRRMWESLRPFAGEPFGDLLVNPKVDILALKKIKDYGKKMATHAKSEAEHDAATAIYYLAIASALVFRNKKITTYSYESLDESFSKLADWRWMPEGIAQLLVKAQRACKQKNAGK